MPGGFTGKYLIIDLGKKSFDVVKPKEEFYKKYLSGYGLGAAVITERQKPGINPLSAESYLGFCTGSPDRDGRHVFRPLHGRRQVAADRRLGRRQLGRLFLQRVEKGRVRRRLLHRGGQGTDLGAHRRREDRVQGRRESSGARTPSRRKRPSGPSSTTRTSRWPASGSPAKRYRSSPGLSTTAAGSPPAPGWARSWVPRSSRRFPSAARARSWSPTRRR